jgi:hypothetical protein
MFYVEMLRWAKHIRKADFLWIGMIIEYLVRIIM